MNFSIKFFFSSCVQRNPYNEELYFLCSLMMMMMVMRQKVVPCFSEKKFPSCFWSFSSSGKLTCFRSNSLDVP